MCSSKKDSRRFASWGAWCVAVKRTGRRFASWGVWCVAVKRTVGDLPAGELGV